MGKEGRQEEGPLVWQLLSALGVHLLLRRESDFQGCSLSWSWASAGLSPRSEGFLRKGQAAVVALYSVPGTSSAPASPQ